MVDPTPGPWFTAASGDLDGDGYDDLVLGCPSAGIEGGEPSTGSAHAYPGGPEGLGAVPMWERMGIAGGGSFGEAFGVGDRDADGDADLFVGAPRTTNGDPYEGLVALFSGDPAGVSSGPVMRDPVASEVQWFEVVVAIDGPVDLVGLMVSADGDSAIEGFLVVGAGDRFVLARDPDPTTNGGLDATHTVAGLSISDRIVLTTDAGTVAEVDVAGLPVGSGRSAGVDPDSELDPQAIWCPATSTYGAGDHGTPGTVNDPCRPDGEGPTPERSCGCSHDGRSVLLAAGLGVVALFRRRRSGG